MRLLAGFNNTVLLYCRSAVYCMVRTLTSEAAAAAAPGGGGGVTSSLEPPLPPPVPDGAEPVYSKKIRDIVSEISQLTLLETAQLNELLKVNICIVNFTPAIFFAAEFWFRSWC